jgi:hypothetical protein
VVVWYCGVNGKVSMCVLVVFFSICVSSCGVCNFIVGLI